MRCQQILREGVRWGAGCALLLLLLTTRAAASDGLFYDPMHDRYHVFEQYNECVVGHPGCRGGWCVHTSVLLALKPEGSAAAGVA